MARELVAFSRQFGELQPHVQKSYRHPDAPEVVNMTNRKPDGSFDEAGARRGAIENLRDGWHSIYPTTRIPQRRRSCIRWKSRRAAAIRVSPMSPVPLLRCQRN